MHPHRETAVKLADLLNGADITCADALAQLNLDPEADGIFTEDDSVFSFSDVDNDMIDFGWHPDFPEDTTLEAELVVVARRNRVWRAELTTQLKEGAGSVLPDPPEKIADAWRRFQAGERVEPYEARAIDEWRADCAAEAGF